MYISEGKKYLLRELGAKWAVGISVWQCIVAWIVALIVKLVVGAFVL